MGFIISLYVDDNDMIITVDDVDRIAKLKMQIGMWFWDERFGILSNTRIVDMPLELNVR